MSNWFAANLFAASLETAPKNREAFLAGLGANNPLRDAGRLSLLSKGASCDGAG